MAPTVRLLQPLMTILLASEGNGVLLRPSLPLNGGLQLPAIAPRMTTSSRRLCDTVECCIVPARRNIKIKIKLSRRALGLASKSSWTAVTPCSSGADGELDSECLSLCDEEGCSVVAEMGLVRILQLGGLLALWFGLSTGYNIQNKVRLNMLCLPWMQSLVSLTTGSLFVGFLWLTGASQQEQL